MRLPERQRGLDAVLQSSQALWHPQPFREIRPQWAIEQPALTTELLALDDDAVEKLNHDGQAANDLLAKHFPELAELAALS